MQKIMFNDRYGLTEAVLNGRKTMTRRIIGVNADNAHWHWNIIRRLWRVIFSIRGRQVALSRYARGEVVAIAQSYKDICDEYLHKLFVQIPWAIEKFFSSPGWKNKMFTRPSLMPHHIKITDIKVERLQDIT